MVLDKNKVILLIIYFVLLISLFFTAGQAFRYKILYQETIRQSSENMVIALGMTVACQELSNVTTDQVKEQYLKTFFKSFLEIKDA